MKKATLTCPECKHSQETDIPTNGCLAFFKCESCDKIVSVPKESSSCCVVCEYSDTTCPARGNSSE